MVSVFIFCLTVLFFPGTVFHELAHYVVAGVVGKVERFSVMPQLRGNRLVFGSVQWVGRYEVFSFFVSVAPLLWWVLLLVLLRLGVVDLGGVFHGVSIGDGVLSLRLGDVFRLYACVQLVWAGCLSLGDLRGVFGGLFSSSGVVVLLLLAGLFILLR